MYSATLVGQRFGFNNTAAQRGVPRAVHRGGIMERDELVREILAAATRVHQTLGPGFLESIYSRALLSELRSRGLLVERERQVKIWYGGRWQAQP